ncbi:META domain-containing protein [Brucepastera parasyntrophica]|uniref:META domain-containing protein n=1 Tax=Brucepastera parasyntrophica TaxID=2880008 RepID=UPI0021097289|nr:META domain-containing protein [Brucepastera parasyntrophica]ULQ59060.1 META domain-containing protein [Brucepastera parasyntrophica]
MKLTKSLLFIAAAVSLAAAGCAGSAKTSQASPDGTSAVFSDIAGKTWKLYEIVSPDGTVTLTKADETMPMQVQAFTLSFDTDNKFAGQGYPNRYFGTLAEQDGNSLKFGMIASTMMAAFDEPFEINEYTFLQYLEKADKWALKDGILSLYSYDAVEKPVTLNFSEI